VAPATLYAVLTAAGIAPFLINGYVNARVAPWPAVYWGFEFLCWVVVPLVVLGTLRRAGGLRLSDIGLNGVIFGQRSIGLIVFTCLLICPLELLVYKYAIGYFRAVLPDEGLFQYQQIVPQSGAGRVLVAAYLALTAGIVEEIYFRGLMFKVFALISTRAVPVYLVFSPLLFASVHWESGLANTAAAYVLGLLAAVAFVAMRNLWPLIAGHVFTDYVWFG
jgi:hypothetical protein